MKVLQKEIVVIGHRLVNEQIRQHHETHSHWESNIIIDFVNLEHQTSKIGSNHGHKCTNEVHAGILAT